MSYPQPLSVIVTKFDNLRQLISQARQFDHLDQKVAAILPENLRSHVRVANFRDGCLVLQADTQAWATELRFRSPEILAALANGEVEESIQSIRIRSKVGKVRPQAQDLPVRRAEMSNDAAAAMKSQADSINDKGIREALLRIAARRDRR